jgi:nicotinate-nucleotide adenylyltransferase
VLLVPVGEAPHKTVDPEPGRDVRLEMATRAVDGNPLIEVSDVEVRRNGPSFTYETLELFEAERSGDELWFLMGADVASGLQAWRAPERVMKLARLGIAARPGTSLDDAEATLEALGAEDRFEVVTMPEIGISSTRIRRRVAQRRPIRYLVPESVIDVIETKGLYR